MARTASIHQSQDIKDNSHALSWRHGAFGSRQRDPFRAVISMLRDYTEHPHAQLNEDDKTKLEKAKDDLHKLYQRPASGRTSALGRKVEKPGTGSPGGPSGQKDGVKHDGTHTNK